MLEGQLRRIDFDASDYTFSLSSLANFEVVFCKSPRVMPLEYAIESETGEWKKNRCFGEATAQKKVRASQKRRNYSLRKVN